MSSVVDERVVQMSFDNDKFEKGVSQTIESLDRLDSTLKKAANEEYFETMKSGINDVEKAFSKSGMVINGVLLGIGHTIEGYLLKVLNSLTSGIRSGFAEYNTQMDSTQTILGNVKDEGKGIDDVTAALDNLNEYADKTIYNFTEMTKNIGMFTAAGSTLETSVATIKGLANAAALAGANSMQAARAWYQVSQAMAAGTFRLMDWRSLENSSIAGEAFQKVIEEVARKDGIAIDAMLKKHGALRYTLEEGWLTSKRFAEAMAILSGEMTEAMMEAKGYTKEQIEYLLEVAKTAEEAATKVKTLGQLFQTTSEAIGSGWAKTFRIIIGDFEKAKKFFTRISNVLNDFIGRVSDFRNDLIDSIMNEGGVNSVYNSVKKTIDHLLAIFTTFFNAARAGFMNIFPKERFVTFFQTLFENVERLTRSFVLNSTNLVKNDLMDSSVWDLKNVNYTVGKLIRIFRDLFAAIDSVWIIIRDITKFIWKLIPGTDKIFDNIKNGNKGLVESLADVLDNIAKFHDVMLVDYQLIPKFLQFVKYELEKLSRTKLFKYIQSGIDSLVTNIKSIWNTIKTIKINPLDALGKAFTVLGTTVAIVVYGIGTGINYLIGLIGTLKSVFTSDDTVGIKDALFGSGEGIDKLVSKTTTLNGSLDRIKDAQDDINGSVNKSPILTFLNAVSNALTEIISHIAIKISNLFEYLYHFPVVKSVVDLVISAWHVIEKVLTGINTLLDDINLALQGDIDAIYRVMGVIGLVISALAALFTFKIIDGITSVSKLITAIAADINAKAFHEIAESMALIAASIFVLSFVDTKKVIELSIILGTLISTLYLFTSVVSLIKNIIEGNAIKKLAEAIKENLLMVLDKFAKRVGIAIIIRSIASAILQLALSFGILALTVELFPDSWESAFIVIASLTGTLAVLAIVIAALTKNMKIFLEVGKTAANIKNITGMAAAFLMFFRLIGIAAIITSIAVAVTMLAGALRLLVGLDFLTEILPAFVTILLLLAAVVAAMVIINKTYTKGTENLFSHLAAMFISLGLALSAIMLSATLIKNDRQLYAIIASLGTVALMLAGFWIGVTYISNKLDASSVSVITADLIFMAAGISLVALAFASSAAILTLSDVTWKEYIAVLGSVAAVVGAIYLLIRMTKGFKVNALSLSTVIGLAVSMATGILTIAVSLKILEGISYIDSDVLTTFAASCLVVLGSIIGFIYAVGSLPTAMSTKLGTLSFLIISVVSSVVAVAGSLKLLSKAEIDPDILGVFGIVSSVMLIVIDVMVGLLSSIAGLTISPMLIFTIGVVILSMVSTVVAVAMSLNSLSGVKINSAVLELFKNTVDIILLMSWAMVATTIFLPNLELLWPVLLTISSIVVALCSGVLEIALALNMLSNVKIDFAVLAVFGAISIISLVVIESFIAVAVVLSTLPEIAAVVAGIMAAVAAVIFSVAAFFTGIAATLYLMSEASKNVFALIDEIALDAEGWVKKVYTAAIAIAAVIPAISLIFFSIGFGIGLAFAGLAVGIASTATIVAAAVFAAMLAVLNEISKYITKHPDEVQEAVHNIVQALKIVIKIVKEEIISEIQKSINESGIDFGEIFARLIAAHVLTFLSPFIIAGLPAILGVAMWTALAAAVASACDALHDVLFEQADWMEAWKEDWDNFWYKIGDTVEDITYELGINIDLVKDKLESWDIKNTGVYKTFKGISDTVGGIGDKINAAKKVGTAVNSTKDASSSTFTKVEDVVNMSIFPNMEYQMKKIVNGWKEAAQSAKEASEEIDGVNTSTQNASKSATGFAGPFKNEIGKLNLALNESKIASLNASKTISEANIETAKTIGQTTISNINNKVAEVKATASTNNAIVTFEKEKSEDVEETNSDMWSTISGLFTDGTLDVEKIVEKGKEMLGSIFGEGAIDISSLSQNGITGILEDFGIGGDSLLDIVKNGLANMLGLENAFWIDSNTMSENQLRNKADLFQRYWSAGEEYQRQANKLYAEANATLYGGTPEARARAKELEAKADELAAKAADAKKTAAEKGITWRQLNTSLLEGTSFEGWWSDLLPDFDEFYNDAVNAWNGADWDNGIDISGYDYKSPYEGGDFSGANQALEESLKERNDLMKDYSVEPEDWTPVINLDQLKNEVNQANGIMTGSLLAAQNAAIGDYINTDSELNPFLKDRWKTTYNFTQNNYSPKALSRIEIYRQTQNQLRISRGF